MRTSAHGRCFSLLNRDSQLQNFGSNYSRLWGRDFKPRSWSLEASLLIDAKHWRLFWNLVQVQKLCNWLSFFFAKAFRKIIWPVLSILDPSHHDNWLLIAGWVRSFSFPGVFSWQALAPPARGVCMPSHNIPPSVFYIELYLFISVLHPASLPVEICLGDLFHVSRNWTWKSAFSALPKLFWPILGEDARI